MGKGDHLRTLNSIKSNTDFLKARLSRAFRKSLSSFNCFTILSSILPNLGGCGEVLGVDSAKVDVVFYFMNSLG
jgi:hypothetical protein